MIGLADRSLPSSGELRACGLAALAEAGLLCLPAHFLLSESGAADVDVGLLALPFVAAYVVGALLACRFRSSRNLALGAGAVGVLAGVTLGQGGLERVAFAVVVALLVCLRVVTLGLRDWRTPLRAELAWGAAVLGLEAFAAAGPLPDWRPALALFVPLFLVAGLASRAATVWAVDGGPGDGAEGSWVKRTIAATAGLAVAMGLSVALAVRGGVLDVVGRWLRPVLSVVEVALLVVVVAAAWPFFWLAEHLHIDPEGLRAALDRLRRSASQARDRVGLPSHGTSFLQRIVGLLVFAAIAYGLYRLLRRARPPQPFERRLREPVARAETAPLPERIDPPPRWRFRPELPAEAVRRLYAEALLDLRDRRLSKDPALTPAEFVPEVAEAFPAGAEDFRALTRAYEDVRYGGRRLPRGSVRDLEVRQRHLRAELRKAGRRHVT